MKIFLQNFSLEVGLGQEELEGDTGETAGVVTPISKMLKTQKQKKSFTYVHTACGTYYIYHDSKNIFCERIIRQETAKYKEVE